MGSIISMPDLPWQGNGRAPYPVVLLFGAPHSQWQVDFAAELVTAATVVIRSDVPAIHLASRIEYLCETADVADWIVAWCGSEVDRFHLDDWTVIGYLMARLPEKILLGMPPDPDHPMASGLWTLARMSQIDVHGQIPTLLGQAIARCRRRRGR